MQPGQLDLTIITSSSKVGEGVGIEKAPTQSGKEVARTKRNSKK
jgi:hypothetical protein